MEKQFILKDFHGCYGDFKAGTVAEFPATGAQALRQAGIATHIDSEKHKAFLAAQAAETKPDAPAELETKPAPAQELETKPAPRAKKGK